MFIVALSIFLISIPGSCLAVDPKMAYEPIKVGVLYSLTGTMAISEKPLVDAIQLAISEIIEDGGNAVDLRIGKGYNLHN